MDFFGSLGFRLVDIAIEDQTINVGEFLDLTVTGTYDDGSEEAITTNLTWATDNAAAVTVAAGRVTAVAPGTATITVVPEPYMIDDFETDASADWMTIFDTEGSSISVFARSAEQSLSGSWSMKATYHAVVGDLAWGVVGIYTIPSGPVDLSGYAGISVQVHPAGTTGSAILVLEDSDGTQLTSALAPDPAPFSGNDWIAVAYAFDDMGRATWTVGDDGVFDLSDVSKALVILDSGSGTVYLDDFIVQ